MLPRITLFSVILALACGSFLPLAAQEARQNQETEDSAELQERLGRRWTCDATIFLVGTNQSFTPPTWGMKTGDPDAVWGDREKSCKKYIENRILTASIWSNFKLTPAEQDRICKQGNGQFRVEYSFDKRPKSWSFTKTMPAPPCDCDLSCPAGYDLDNNSLPGHPRCVRLLCRGAAQGVPDNVYGPHDNGLGIWSGNVYHHQPVVRGACHFQGQGTNGRWTPWLNRDAPSGTGDFETLREFVTAGQACSTPQKIECRRRGTTQLVVTGVGAGGERYTCDLSVGGVCDNRQQTGGVTCSDYEVRFLCP